MPSVIFVCLLRFTTHQLQILTNAPATLSEITAMNSLFWNLSFGAIVHMVLMYYGANRHVALYNTGAVLYVTVTVLFAVTNFKVIFLQAIIPLTVSP